jgi:tetratricopeptide (TPR) repeat protein
MKSLIQNKRIVIRRDDHIGDRLGAIFLDPNPDHQDWIIDLVRGYLGRRPRLIKIELTYDRLEIQLMVQVLSEEAGRLAAAANELRKNGAPRNALHLLLQALELDQFHISALSGAAAALIDLKRYPEALAMSKRALEAGGESADLLLSMARISLKLERTASAVSYLERAHQISPGHFGVRRALIELGRKPRPAQRSAQLRSSPRGNPAHAQ